MKYDDHQFFLYPTPNVLYSQKSQQPGMEELANLEKMMLAKGRERLESLVESGTVTQEEADAEYEQTLARIRTGGLMHALALGTHHLATMGTNADATERAAPNDCRCHQDDWCTCGALRRAEQQRVRRPPVEEAGTSSPACKPGPTQLGPRSPSHETHYHQFLPHPPPPDPGAEAQSDREEILREAGREDRQLTSPDTSSEEDILTFSLGSDGEIRPTKSAPPANAVDILATGRGPEEEDQRPGSARPAENPHLEPTHRGRPAPLTDDSIKEVKEDILTYSLKPEEEVQPPTTKRGMTRPAGAPTRGGGSGGEERGN